MFEPKKELPAFVKQANQKRAAGVCMDLNAFRPKARALLDKRQTGADKTDVNPFDTAPTSEAEAIHQLRVQAALEGMVGAMQGVRSWVMLDMLAQMTAIEAVLEGELPEIDGQRHGIFLFSVSGTLDGTKVHRCLLGGHCIVISADNPHAARAIAQEGLLDSAQHAREFAFAQSMGVDLTPENPGIILDSELRPRR